MNKTVTFFFILAIPLVVAYCIARTRHLLAFCNRHMPCGEKPSLPGRENLLISTLCGGDRKLPQPIGGTTICHHVNSPLMFCCRCGPCQLNISGIVEISRMTIHRSE
ncbi:hypothetical protein Tcan_00501, partial [Toxocara canis]